jgi:hypothetical protein
MDLGRQTELIVAGGKQRLGVLKRPYCYSSCVWCRSNPAQITFPRKANHEPSEYAVLCIPCQPFGLHQYPIWSSG